MLGRAQSIQVIDCRKNGIKLQIVGLRDACVGLCHVPEQQLLIVSCKKATLRFLDLKRGGKVLGRVFGAEASAEQQQQQQQ